MSEHLDLDALADHLAGEGDGAAHLATCAVCQDRLAELAVASVTVSAALAALPPPRLPPELGKRIAAALAAEPAPAPSALAAPSATVTPLAGRRPAARRTWPLSVAAAVVLVCGAGLGYTLLAGGGNDSAEQTAALDSAAVPDPNAALERSTSGTDYADAAAVAGGLANVLAGTAPQEALGATADSRRAPPAAPLSSGTGLAEAGDPLDRLRDPAGLASCLLALLPPEEPDVRPLALDYARYGATPALAVVLPDPDPAKVSVFVVGPDCSQDNDSTLLFTRLTKP